MGKVIGANNQDDLSHAYPPSIYEQNGEAHKTDKLRSRSELVLGRKSEARTVNNHLYNEWAAQNPKTVKQGTGIKEFGYVENPRFQHIGDR